MKKHNKKSKTPAGTNAKAPPEKTRPIDASVLDKAADLELKRRDADYDSEKEAHGD